MRFELEPFAMPAGYGDAVIPLADAKAHLYVDHDEDDALISILRDAAIDLTEKYCALRLKSSAGHKWRAERFLYPLRLGIGPVQSIESASYLDRDGNVVAVDVADFRIGLHGELLPALGKSFPGDVGGGVEIGFTAGFESGKIPAGLIAAAKLFMGHLYANREDVIIGTAAIEIPNGFRMMCGQYRMPVI